MRPQIGTKDSSFYCRFRLAGEEHSKVTRKMGGLPHIHKDTDIPSTAMAGPLQIFTEIATHTRTHNQEWLPSLLLWVTDPVTFTQSLSLCNCVKRQPGQWAGPCWITKWRAGLWWWRDERRRIRCIVPSKVPWMIYNTNWRLHECLGKLICTSLPRSLSHSFAHSAQPCCLLSSGDKKKVHVALFRLYFCLLA